MQSTVQTVETVTHIQQWEYVHVYITEWGRKHATELHDNMADMGRQGWELVSLVPVANDGAFPGTTSYLLAMFKRPAVAPVGRLADGHVMSSADRP